MNGEDDDISRLEFRFGDDVNVEPVTPEEALKLYQARRAQDKMRNMRLDPHEVQRIVRYSDTQRHDGRSWR